MPSIKRIERLSHEPSAAGSQLSATARASGLTVTLSMTIAEFAPKRSVVMQGKTMGTSTTRFYGLEPADGRTKAAIGGASSGALVWPARQGGKNAPDEITLAVETRIE